MTAFRRLAEKELLRAMRNAVRRNVIPPSFTQRTCRCCSSPALPGEYLCDFHTWQDVRANHYEAGARS
jgi:hypothetical protein